MVIRMMGIPRSAKKEIGKKKLVRECLTMSASVQKENKMTIRRRFVLQVRPPPRNKKKKMRATLDLSSHIRPIKPGSFGNSGVPTTWSGTKFILPFLVRIGFYAELHLPWHPRKKKRLTKRKPQKRTSNLIPLPPRSCVEQVYSPMKSDPDR